MSLSIRTDRIRSPAIGFVVCAGVAICAPLLFRTIGPLVVVAAIPLAIGSFALRRHIHASWLRAALAGASVGLTLLFAYAFSPPILERIGHEFGWPGRSLLLWERFTAPVYLHCCTTPWFWRFFEIWDRWTAMMFDRSTFAVSRIPVVRIAALGLMLFALLHLRSVVRTAASEPKA